MSLELGSCTSMSEWMRFTEELTAPSTHARSLRHYMTEEERVAVFQGDVEQRPDAPTRTASAASADSFMNFRVERTG